LTPSTNQAVAIMTIPKIVANENFKDIPENVMIVINKRLKAWAEGIDIGDKKKESKPE